MPRTEPQGPGTNTHHRPDADPTPGSRPPLSTPIRPRALRASVRDQPPASACPPRGLRRRHALTILLLLGVAVAATALFARTIHPFLAPVDPIDSPTLVVEGWIPDYALESALEHHRAHAGQRIITTGGPLPRGSHLAEYTNHAAVAGATLLKLGIPTNQLLVVPSPRLDRNRTFASAIALRQFCDTNHLRLDSINLVSLGAHARRSRICFQAALADHVRVGIIAIENRDYDPVAWWKSSEGVKSVLSELLGLAYAWLAIDYGS